MKTYDIYLFDLDGTLTDSVVIWLDIVRQALAEVGITGLDNKTIAKHTHDFDEMTKLGVSPSDLNRFKDAAHRVAVELLPTAVLHDGAANMLSKLRNAGKRTGLYTAVRQPGLNAVLEHHGLFTFFDAIVARSDVARGKPYPDGLHKAMELLGEPRENYSRAVYIGDKDTDLMTAQNAGIDAVLYFPPSHAALYDRSDLEALKPTAIITGWGELLKTLI